jgi:hypothetical protein
MKPKKAAICKSCPAGVAKASIIYGAKHVAAFIRLSSDAGSIPATSTKIFRQGKIWWMLF